MNEPEAASAEWRVRRLIEASNTSRSAHQPLVSANGRQIGTRYIAKYVGSNRHAHADLVLLPKAAEDRLAVDMLRLHAGREKRSDGVGSQSEYDISRRVQSAGAAGDLMNSRKMLPTKLLEADTQLTSQGAVDDVADLLP